MYFFIKKLGIGFILRWLRQPNKILSVEKVYVRYLSNVICVSGETVFLNVVQGQEISLMLVICIRMLFYVFIFFSSISISLGSTWLSCVGLKYQLR